MTRAPVRLGQGPQQERKLSHRVGLPVCGDAFAKQGDAFIGPRGSCQKHSPMREWQTPGALACELDCLLAEASVQHRGPDLKHAMGTPR